VLYGFASSLMIVQTACTAQKWESFFKYALELSGGGECYKSHFVIKLKLTHQLFKYLCIFRTLEMTSDAPTIGGKHIASNVASARCKQHINRSVFWLAQMTLCVRTIYLFSLFVESNVISNASTNGLSIHTSYDYTILICPLQTDDWSSGEWEEGAGIRALIGTSSGRHCWCKLTTFLPVFTHQKPRKWAKSKLKHQVSGQTTSWKHH